ncbi:uncharacterized protein A4U43_C05F14870, partial [Asparagus officinalis]
EVEREALAIKEPIRNKAIGINAEGPLIEVGSGSEPPRRLGKEPTIEDPIDVAYEKTSSSALGLFTVVHDG